MSGQSSFPFPPAESPSPTPASASESATPCAESEIERAVHEDSAPLTLEESVAPLGASEAATPSEKLEMDGFTHEETVQITSGESSVAPPGASEAATPSEKLEMDGVTHEETVQITSGESSLAPPGAREAVPPSEKLEMDGVTHEEAVQITSGESSVAPPAPREAVTPSEKLEMDAAPHEEGVQITSGESSVAPPGASSPAILHASFATRFAELEADAKIKADKLQLAGQAHENAWEELIPILDNIQKHLSLRGENRDRNNSSGLPTWTEWWRNFQKENDFDACLRRVQKKLKEFRARVRAREDATNQKGESEEKLRYVGTYDKLRFELAHAKKSSDNPKDVLIRLIRSHFSAIEVGEIAHALQSDPTGGSAAKAPVSGAEEGRSQAPEAAGHRIR